MYYTSKSQTGSTRLIGMIITAVVCAALLIALLNVAAPQMMNMLTETEVVIIEEDVIEDEEPPPPPPVDVELPPPPPQVILPDFVFDTPPPPTAIQQVQQVARPAPPPVVRPAPPPPPKAAAIASNPIPGRRFEKPEYPAASQRAKEEGAVTVSTCVDATGKMTDVKLVKSSGFPRLDEATIKGLPRTRLDPAKDTNGKAVAFCEPPYQLTIVWEMPKD